MRARLLLILVGLLGLFSLAVVFRVDQLVFADKIAWGESQAKAQIGALAQALSSEVKGAGENLQLAWPQVAGSQKDYPAGLPYSRFLMMAELTKAESGEWSLTQKQFLHQTPVRSWAPNYAVLALRGLRGMPMPVGQNSVMALLDPNRKVYFLLLTRTPTQWLAALMGPELFQGVMDRQKGQLSSVSVVNPLGQALGHTVPEYVGSLLTDDPVVTELIRSGANSGQGLYQNARGSVQGFYEHVPRTNLYVVVATPVKDLLAGRKETRWQLLLMGFGFALVGAALILLLVKDQKPAPVASSRAPMPKGPASATPEASDVKLKAYTTAASSLAHELRGPLLGLLGRTRLLREQTPDASVQQELLKIEEGARDVHGTLHKLLAFAGEKEEPLVPTSLREVLQRTLRLCEVTLKAKRIDVETKFDDAGTVQGQPGLLTKAFEQIIENSVQAMERGLNKKLRIELKSSEQGPRVCIQDTGEGIRADQVNQIFDPFFTTRSSSGHSGLGLSLALGIIKGCGGTIRVQSAEGQGTEMDIVFSNEQEQKKSAEPAAVSEASWPQSPTAALIAEPESKMDLPEVLNDRLMEKTLDLIDRLDDLPETFGSQDVPAPPPPKSARSRASDDGMSSHAPSAHEDFMRFTAKIDKPKPASKKKENRLLSEPTEIRRPGERA